MRVSPACLRYMLLLALCAGCSHLTRPPSNPDPNPPREDPNVTPAELIASSGHGAVFDQLGRAIEMNTAKINEILSSMIGVLRRDAIKQFTDEERTELRAARDLVRSGDIDPIDRALVQSAIVGQLLRKSTEEVQSRFGWRHRILLSGLHIDYLERIEVLPDAAVALDIRDFMNFNGTGGDDYVSRCRSEGVPIPRPWSETSTAWKYHGQLQDKLIQSTLDAHLWTYEHPQLRGGCIALPRGSGDKGSAAGIICQSATTGKACFWDNILAKTTGNIGWKGKTLTVANLRNGDTLGVVGDNCIDCHRGNNVFLISPDDPTWAKVIRPTEQSDVGQNFTTHVENTSIPRYIPVSSQAGWNNVAAPPCLGCHERPAVGFAATPLMSPRGPNFEIQGPDCRTSNYDPGKCYGATRRYMSDN